MLILAERCQVPADWEEVIGVIGGYLHRTADADLLPGDPGVEVPGGRGGSAGATRDPGDLRVVSEDPAFHDRLLEFRDGR